MTNRTNVGDDALGVPLFGDSINIFITLNDDVVFGGLNKQKPHSGGYYGSYYRRNVPSFSFLCRHE